MRRAAAAAAAVVIQAWARGWHVRTWLVQYRWLLWGPPAMARQYAFKLAARRHLQPELRRILRGFAEGG